MEPFTRTRIGPFPAGYEPVPVVLGEVASGDVAGQLDPPFGRDRKCVTWSYEFVGSDARMLSEYVLHRSQTGEFRRVRRVVRGDSDDLAPIDSEALFNASGDDIAALNPGHRIGTT